MTDLKPLDIARNLRALKSLKGLAIGAQQELDLAADCLEQLYNIALSASLENLSLRGLDIEDPEDSPSCLN